MTTTSFYYIVRCDWGDDVEDSEDRQFDSSVVLRSVVRKIAWTPAFERPWLISVLLALECSSRGDGLGKEVCLLLCCDSCFAWILSAGVHSLDGANGR